MSFRRNKDKATEWKRFRDRCRPILVACGLPDEGYANQRMWWYFLDHASLSTGHRAHWFSLDKLSHEQLQHLCEFFEAEYGSEEYPPLILQVLRSTCGRRLPGDSYE